MPSDSAVHHFNQALDFESRGRCSDAASSYREVIRKDPTHVRALLRLGLVLRDLGRDEEANAAFATALRLHSAGVVAPPASFALWSESAVEESATIAG